MFFIIARFTVSYQYQEAHFIRTFKRASIRTQRSQSGGRMGDFFWGQFFIHRSCSNQRDSIRKCFLQYTFITPFLERKLFFSCKTNKINTLDLKGIAYIWYFGRFSTSCPSLFCDYFTLLLLGQGNNKRIRRILLTATFNQTSVRQ